MHYALGIDLGGSSVKAVAVTAEGRLLEKSQRNFDVREPLEWAALIQEIILGLEKKQQSKAARIGLSAPGLASSDQRSIAFMPGRLQGLEGLDWSRFLRRKSTIPVLNDAQAALVGEAWLGAASGCANVIMLTLGTGVGGAAIVDGRLLRGHIGRAGHLGHICLDPDGLPDFCRTPGSLEVAIGNYNIGVRSGGKFQTTHQLVEAFKAGDEDARSIWLKSVRHLACAVVSFINILDPAKVIVGGGIARSGKALFDPLCHYLAEMEWRPGGRKVRIVRAQMGEFAGAFGAARHSLLASSNSRGML